MKPYHQLTRLGQLRRLRKLAQTALEFYGLGKAPLTFLRHFANTTYRVDLPKTSPHPETDGPYLSNRYLLRVLVANHWGYAQGEMTWLAALSEQAGLPVPAPVPNKDGGLLTQITTPGMPDGRIVSLMRWIDGQKPGKFLDLSHYQSWGKLVGRLHAFAATWQPPEGFERYLWDWEGLLGKRYVGEGVHELVAWMPETLREPFQIVSQEARRVMESLGKGPDAYGMVHGDMFPDNTLLKGDDLRIIDFEDCGFGYWLWDIAIALESKPWADQWYRQRDAFLEGYTQNHPLPDAQLKHLDLFCAVNYATVVLWATQFILDEPERGGEYEIWRDENGARLLRYFQAR